MPYAHETVQDKWYYMRVCQKNETGLERNFDKPLNIWPLMY